MLPSWLHVCRVVILQGYIDSNLCDTINMSEAYSLCPNIKVIYHHVHIRFMIMFNYDYLVVKNDDTDNG
jgi:hypothetical protein